MAAAEVLYKYASSLSDELILRKGEVVVVIDKPEEDWWRCRNSNGDIGLAPRNYLKVLPLPDGWKSAVEKETGDVYYYNNSTGAIQWEFPIEASSPKPTSSKFHFDDHHLEQRDDKKSSKNENGNRNATNKEENKKESYHEKKEIHRGVNGDDENKVKEKSKSKSRDAKKKNDVHGNGIASDLPLGWTSHVDKSSGDVYYYNESSGESTWEKPNQFPSRQSLSRGEGSESNGDLSSLNRMRKEADDKMAALRNAISSERQDEHHASRFPTSNDQVEKRDALVTPPASPQSKHHKHNKSSTKKKHAHHVHNNLQSISMDEINKMIEDRVAQELLKREDDIVRHVEEMLREKFVTNKSGDSTAKNRRKTKQAAQESQQLSSRSADSKSTNPSSKSRLLAKNKSNPDLHFPELQSPPSHHPVAKEESKLCSDVPSLPPLVSPPHHPALQQAPEYEEFPSGQLQTLIPDTESTAHSPHHKQEGASLTLKHVHGFLSSSHSSGSGSSSASAGRHLQWVSRSHIVFPASSLVVLMHVKTFKQQFFKEHSNEVTCLAVHPEKTILASGQAGKSGRILVWSSSSLSTLQELTVEKTKGLLAVDFSGDGRLLLAVGEHETTPVVIFNWQQNEVLSTVCLGHMDVYQIGFNSHQFTHQVLSENQSEGQSCYTIVSCGTRSVKFWTLRRVSEAVGVGQSQNKPKKGDFKARKLAVPKSKQKLTWSYSLEGNAASLPRKHASSGSVEMTCFCVVPEEQGRHALPQAKVLTGASNGCVYLWRQLELPAEQVEGGYHYWFPRGSLLCVVSDVHDGYITAMDHFASCNGSVHSRVSTCSKDGTVNLWELGTKQEKESSPMRHMAVVSVVGSDPALGQPRAVAYNTDGSAIIIGNSQHTICTLVGPGVSATSPEGEKESVDATIRMHTILHGHSNKGRRVSPHPFMDICATVASDKTLRLWSVKTSSQVAQTRIGGCGSCLTFTPDGGAIAVGTETGEVLILTCTYLQFCLENDAEPGPDQKRPKWEILGRKFVSGKGGQSQKKDVSKTEITAMRYSPNGEVLAVATRDKVVHLLNTAGGYKRMAACKGHSGAILSLDFSDDGVLLQSSDNIREALCWELPAGKLMNDVGRAQHAKWETWTNMLGPNMQGICNGSSPQQLLEPNGHNLSSLISAASRSNSSRALVVAGSGQSHAQHCLKLFQHPCLASALAKEYTGHASAISDVCFLNSDRYVVSLGGNDGSLMVWVHRDGEQSTSSSS